MTISVLMSVYNKELPQYLHIAIKSIFEDQYVKPLEIILVEDGELTLELYDEIKYWKDNLGDMLKVISLPENVGLAKALNTGLKYCTGDYIARMDTDDISLPERFQKQIEFLEKNENVDVVGSWIEEFNDTEDVNHKIEYPIDHIKMRNFFGKRNPLAHPTVMFRKSFFEKAGDYPINTDKNEDTMLWYKGFKSNCIFANIPQVLVKMRVNNNFFNRRNGMKKSFNELKDRMTIIHNLGLSKKNYIYALIRLVVFSIPSSSLTKLIYKIGR